MGGFLWPSGLYHVFSAKIAAEHRRLAHECLQQTAACGTGFELEFDPVASENFDESTLNRLVENLVRRCPEQYLWSYNRHRVPRLVSQQPAQS